MGSAEWVWRDGVSFEAQLLDVVQQAVIVTDVEGRVIFWNAFAETLFGWPRDEALGKSIVELTPHESSRDEASAIMKRLAAGGSWAGDFRVGRKDGTTFTAFVVDSPILGPDGKLAGIVGVSTDVSEQRALEAQLRQAKRMEVIGRLAGGVAHDFNNLLTVVLGNLDLLEQSGELSPAGASLVTEISDAATRAAGLTRQLLSFSKRDIVQPVAVDVGVAIAALQPILRRLLREDVELCFEPAPTPLFTVLDRAQLDQVIMNLALNARDAMPQGGRLTMRVAAVDAASVTAKVEDGGRFVHLSVTDTGGGIAPELLGNVFEPFFTTKGDHGTGLGLATVEGIVESAGGGVEVESRPGETTFHVFFLRAEAPRSEPESPTPDERGHVAAKTLLLVEDQERLRPLLARVLEADGHRVHVAQSAEHALAMSVHPDVDLLVTDIVMAGMNGIGLAERLRAERPELPVVFMTGYTDDSVSRRIMEMPSAVLVLKPFRPDELTAAVRRLLDG